MLGKCNIGFFSSWAILRSMVLEECGFEAVCFVLLFFFSKLNGLPTLVTFAFRNNKGQNVNSRCQAHGKDWVYSLCAVGLSEHSK